MVLGVDGDLVDLDGDAAAALVAGMHQNAADIVLTWVSGTKNNPTEK